MTIIRSVFLKLMLSPFSRFPFVLSVGVHVVFFMRLLLTLCHLHTLCCYDCVHHQ